MFTRSEHSLNAVVSILITESGIVVTDVSGSLRLLDKKDLSSITKIVDAK